MTELPKQGKCEESEADWDQWAEVRAGLEKALRDPDHALDPKERRDLLIMLQRTLWEQAELHVLRSLRTEGEEGDVLIGRKKTGRGGTDWSAAAHRFADLLSHKHKTSPDDAIRKIAEENNITPDTVCQGIQKIRPGYKKQLRAIESSESIPGDFRNHFRSFVEALYQLPQRPGF